MSDLRNAVKNNGNNQALSVILPIHQGTNSFIPFVHALKLAYASKGELEIVDVRAEAEATEHIGVRSLLEKWGVLPSSAQRSDVAQIGLKVKKIVKEGNKRREITKRLDEHLYDILVIGTEYKSGIGLPFGRDLAEYLADYFGRITLFIPSNARPFIDQSTGVVTLRKILVPSENSKSVAHALVALRKVLSLFPDISPEIIGIHVGKNFPEIDTTLLDGLRWRAELGSEAVVASILDSAERNDTDLIVMATNGRDTLQQKIIGSNTEQVLRSSKCPVLSVAT